MGKTSGKDGIEMDRNAFARQRAAWDCLRWFDETLRTEAEFFARMETMPDDDVVLLKAFYEITDDRELFRMICAFWNVQILRMKAG
jgi:hypothetical protein